MTSAENHLERAQPQPVGVDRAMLDRALGGWRGLIDSGVPAAVFVLVYMLNGLQLRPAVLAAVGSGVAIALWRLVRRQDLQQVAAGFAGVAISALVASRTGRAEDFFLMGLLINVGYCLAHVVSIVVRWPLVGLIVGYFREDPTGWRADGRQYRAYATASWIWAAMFGVRLLVQLPLYAVGAVGALGVAKLVMGWPLFLLAAYLTYRVIKPVVAEADLRQSVGLAEPGLEPEAS